MGAGGRTTWAQDRLGGLGQVGPCWADNCWHGGLLAAQLPDRPAVWLPNRVAGFGGCLAVWLALAGWRWLSGPVSGSALPPAWLTRCLAVWLPGRLVG